MCHALALKLGFQFSYLLLELGSLGSVSNGSLWLAAGGSGGSTRLRALLKLGSMSRCRRTMYGALDAPRGVRCTPFSVRR